jgi:hypothetical protein
MLDLQLPIVGARGSIKEAAALRSLNAGMAARRVFKSWPLFPDVT